MYGFFWWDSFKKELDKGYLILFSLKKVKSIVLFVLYDRVQEPKGYGLEALFLIAMISKIKDLLSMIKKFLIFDSIL